jgi:small nuclear ribonucleoprotein (snRNP)-like protein
VRKNQFSALKKTILYYTAVELKTKLGREIKGKLIED